MKTFLTIVFGGTALVFVGIGLSYAAKHTWTKVAPVVAKEAGTLTFSKTVKYSAGEEEDLINSTASMFAGVADGLITAQAYIIKNLDTGKIVDQKESVTLMPIASLTKLVTAVVVHKLIDDEKEIDMSGTTYQAKELMYPLLMVSSNEAAEAFAKSYGRMKFIQNMNMFVQSIGAYRTSFSDPSGLSPKNVSTVSDMAIILDWIIRHDRNILGVTITKSKTIRGHTWVNPTHFLSWSYYLGGKNGYTTEADRTGASLFKLGATKDVYAVIVLGSHNRDADVARLISKVK